MSEATDAPPAPAGGLGAPPPGAAPAAGRPPRSVLREAAAGVRRPLAAAMLLRSGHQVFEAFVPVLVGVVVDRAVDGGSATALGGWIAVLVADFLALSLCFRFGSRATVAAAEEAAHALRVRLSGRLLAPGHTAGRDRLPGELMSVAVSDTQQIGRFAAFAVQGVSAVVALALGAALLLRMSVPLGLLVLLGTPAVLVAMNRLGRPLERRGAAEQAAAARAAGTAVDYVAGLRVLKGLRAEAPPTPVTRRPTGPACGPPSPRPASRRCWTAPRSCSAESWSPPSPSSPATSPWTAASASATSSPAPACASSSSAPPSP